MKKFDRVVTWLKNKYIVTVLVFIVWVAFFDRNDMISQYSYRRQLHKLQADKEYFVTAIEQNKKDLHELVSNTDNLEKFAREKYRMKKDNEDIFLIVRDSIK